LPRWQSTPQERDRVFELADRGLSARAIADDVWRDSSKKNRVLRLLAGRRRAQEAERRARAELPGPQAEPISYDQQMRELEALVRRTKAIVLNDLAAGKADPSKLETIARLELRIEHYRQFVRLRELTRG
jgi:chromatin segregation and condensation protein Rec8/ScpA/Scc1 (kleisin family)